jgi:tetratricopeptide (TPR) repeat protein
MSAVSKALALSGDGRWGEALRALSPRAATRVPRSLTDFYTFVGEDDLLHENPLVTRLSPREERSARRALESLPRDDARARSLRAFVELCCRRWARACAEADRAGDSPSADLIRAAAWWLRGDAERTKRWVPRALRAAERAAASGSREALLLRAQIRFEFDDHEGSLSDLESVLALTPGDDRTRVGKVDKLLDMGRFDEALREVDALARRHPRAWWIRAQRGRILGLAGRCELALVELEAASRLNARSGAVHAWRAEALRKLGRLGEARRAVDLAKRLQPRYSLAWELSGRLALQERDPVLASRDLDRACRLDPVRSLSFVWRGEARFKRGRYAAAWRDFERAAPLEPRTCWNDPDAAGDPRRREERFWLDLDAAVASGRGGAWPRLLRGRFLAAMGREPEALVDLTAAERARGIPARARAEALRWRGYAALRLGSPRRALLDLDASLRLAPASARARAWRGLALLSLGRESEALRAFDSALRRPDRALLSALLARARTHERAGRLDAARRDYEEAFALDGAAPAARESLARLSDLERAGVRR